jgi:RNA polymerase sigma-70 factor (ECF subfamily)
LGGQTSSLFRGNGRYAQSETFTAAGRCLSRNFGQKGNDTVQTDEMRQIARAKRGDPQAMGALYDHHHLPIFRFIRSRVRDQALAEDLTGEVFTRMVRHLPGYQVEGVPFRAWLYRIARNLIIDHHRRAQRHTLVDIDKAINLRSPQDDPMQIAERNLSLDKVQHALTMIDPAQREVVELRFLAGLSLREAAETLDKSIGAVKSLQHRGLKALRTALYAVEVTE